MKKKFKNIIQAAGIFTLNEAEMLIDAGFNCIGFPLRLGYHKEDIPDKEVKNIISQIKNKCLTTLITYLETADDIIALNDFIGSEAVQIHGDIEISQIQKLINLKPDLMIIKSLIIRNDNWSEIKKQIFEFSDFVDFFITDTFDPETGASGATGKTHDWNISKKIVEISPKPVIIAGGLNCNNLKDAITHTKAAGVDVHTGIEDKEGLKDKNLANEFCRIANSYL